MKDKDRQNGRVKRKTPSKEVERPKNPDAARRAYFHDYNAPAIYHLTYTTHPHRPALARVINVATAGARPLFKSELTELGERVQREIESIPLYHPKLKVLLYVIMPDHVHMVVRVLERLDRKLGRELSGFAAACSKACMEIHGGEKQTLFKTFYDQILYGKDQLAAMLNYVADNPRRYGLKHLFPDLFRRCNSLSIDGEHFKAYGNLFLLRNFDRQCVIVHRADSEQARAANRSRWLACAANGGVLVSAFISPDEQAIRDRAIELGGNLIVIHNRIMGERYSPPASEFELCVAGRLLLLYPHSIPASNKLTRETALALNAVAERLAILGPTAPFFVER